MHTHHAPHALPTALEEYSPKEEEQLLRGLGDILSQLDGQHKHAALLDLYTLNATAIGTRGIDGYEKLLKEPSTAKHMSKVPVMMHEILQGRMRVRFPPPAHTQWPKPAQFVLHHHLTTPHTVIPLWACLFLLCVSVSLSVCLCLCLCRRRPGICLQLQCLACCSLLGMSHCATRLPT